MCRETVKFRNLACTPVSPYSTLTIPKEMNKNAVSISIASGVDILIRVSEI